MVAASKQISLDVLFINYFSSRFDLSSYLNNNGTITNITTQNQIDYRGGFLDFTIKKLIKDGKYEMIIIDRSADNVLPAKVWSRCVQSVRDQIRKRRGYKVLVVIISTIDISPQEFNADWVISLRQPPEQIQAEFTKILKKIRKRILRRK